MFCLCLHWQFPLMLVAQGLWVLFSQESTAICLLIWKQKELPNVRSLFFSLMVEGPLKVLKVWLHLLEEEGFLDLVMVLEGSLWKDCQTETA